MIAPLAISLALAFWTPFNHGMPVCPQGLTVETYNVHSALPVEAEALGWARLGEGCRVHLAADAGTWPVAAQCAVIAHEIGHAVFGLRHSNNPRSVMYAGDALPTIAACHRQHPRRWGSPAWDS